MSRNSFMHELWVPCRKMNLTPSHSVIQIVHNVEKESLSLPNLVALIPVSCEKQIELVVGQEQDLLCTRDINDNNVFIKSHVMRGNNEALR